MAPAAGSFDFQPCRRVGKRYVIEHLLGRGSEGEVYQVREADTSIRRAAKFYFPEVDPDHRKSIRHAQKLNALRLCPIVLQYHHSEVITVKRRHVLALISEFCEGEPLAAWVARHRGQRLAPYTALHVLYHLVRGLEAVHALGQYHGDVHTENILVRPLGIRFDLKLIDFYDWGRPARFKQRQDLRDTVRVFYDCLGGQRHYARQPDEVRHICAGLRATILHKRFPTMTALRRHLEQFPWATLV